MIADLLLTVAFLFFVIRGYMRGTTRAAVGLLAASLALAVSFVIPRLLVFFVKYFYEAGDPGIRFTSQILTFLLVFAVLQVGGFVLTGLMETIGMTQASKVGGAFFGFLTASVIVCMPIAALKTVPQLKHWSDAQSTIEDSNLMRLYAPMVQQFLPRNHHRHQA